MEPVAYFRFVLAFAFVLALIGTAAFLARRYGAGSLAGWRPRGQQRRLGVVEVLPLDARRRLLLVRRDGVEHLILTGSGQDVVVESRIAPAAFRDTLAEAGRQDATLQDTTLQDQMPPDQTPRGTTP
ncbi:MAG TPA: flagellar biosynthetic protein FliO [Azospirillaceae bacterium]|nr:flagellar biosynthetic protein FliO [Azospirillaceae bacterium]